MSTTRTGSQSGRRLPSPRPSLEERARHKPSCFPLKKRTFGRLPNLIPHSFPLCPHPSTKSHTVCVQRLCRTPPPSLFPLDLSTIGLEFTLSRLSLPDCIFPLSENVCRPFPLSRSLSFPWLISKLLRRCKRRASSLPLLALETDHREHAKRGKQRQYLFFLDG